MEDIKPKKEKKFLKAVGKVAGILLQEFVLGLGRKFIGKKIDRIGNKRQALLIFLALFCNIAFASVDSIPYPITGNKQRLGWQTSGNGLVWRGRSQDTITKPTSYVDKNVKAYLILDSVRGTIFVWRQTYWDSLLVGSGGGGGLTMPFDSITFNTAKDGAVGVGEVEYNDTQGSLIQGLKGGNVTNVIGQQLHQRVNNRTGSALAKGDVVYLSGSQGNRITVAKALATSDPTSANTFGIVAENIADNASGYVITEGLITGLNTSALTQDSAVYLSGTTAGALTSTKPQAPIHGVYIGVCVKTNAGSGEVFVKIRNGQELDELHDVQITSPVDKASLYYKSSEGLWRDTTAALLVSDTASMLTPYFRDADTTSLNLTSRFAAKLNISDTASMLTNYLRTGVAASTYLTQSNAASTYLPLIGGTLSGSLDINTNNGANNYQDSTLKVTYNQSSFGANQNVTGIYSSVNTSGYTSTGILSEASTIYSTAIGIKGKATQSDINGPGVAYGIVGEIAASGSGSNGSTYAGYFNNTSTVGGNNYGLYVNTASGGDYGIYQTGTGVNYLGSNTSIGGTLGVTGQITSTGQNYSLLRNFSATNGWLNLVSGVNTGGNTGVFLENSSGNDRLIGSLAYSGGLATYTNTSLHLGTDNNVRLTISGTGNVGIGTTSVNAKLDVRGSAIFNEDSGDNDFRVESDGNANMVFVDASTDRVGIGTNAPTKTLDINGEVKISTTTATPTSLLGKDGSNVVGNVRVITPLALAGDSINLNTVPISKGGTGSTSESGARSNLGVGYVFYASTAGDAIQLSSNKVFIVNSGGASTTTITLGNATAGRLYMIKNLATGTVISDSSNVIPLNGGSAGTAILSAGNTTTQWCTLVCDGTNWHIMQSN